MIEVTIDLYIEEKPEKVFAFISDFANNPQWQDGMVSCVFTSEPPLRVGSTYDQKAQFLGRDIISSFIAFREQVITRRTKFELNKARDRAHVLLGLVVAVLR